MRATLLAGCALLLPCSAFSTTYHVAPDSSGDFLNIQAAIDAAASGDEILLSDGTFTGDGNWDLNFGAKELVLRSENGYEATTIDCGFDSQHDIRHRGFIVDGGQTEATKIEGITVERSASFADGSAFLLVGVSPLIQNIRIQRCAAFNRGTGMFVHGGSPTIEDCVFLRPPYGWEDGAAIYSEQAQPTVLRCLFDSFSVRSVVDLDGGSMTDCTFDHTYGQGGEQFGICVRILAGHVSLVRCAFRNAFGFGLFVDSSAEVFIGSCLFEDNFSATGPGIYGGGTITVRNTTFRNNFADDTAAITFWGGALSLDHCVFFNNGTCNLAFPNRASAVYAGNATLHVSHCTFVRNRNICGRQGSAITIEGGTASIDHTIIAFGGQLGPPDGAIHCIGAPASLAVSCTDIFGNDGGDWTGCIAGMDGANGNISADPLFCDIAAGDLSLQGDSPCAPANIGECGLIGALGPWCGPLAVEPRTWGSIKALYR